MPRNRPTATELTEAVREFLEREIQPAIGDEGLAFRLRIALNVLAIVERELALGPAQEREHRAALNALLGTAHEDMQPLAAELCERIRAGAFDEEHAALHACLRHIALGKLAIDNPNYSSYRALTAPGS